MDTSRMKFPFGKCAVCDGEFDSDLRDEYGITHCPWCGKEIDDFFSIIDALHRKMTENDIFCEDCGRRIYERNGKGASWIDETAGVCSGPCERELCGKCACWNENGECQSCATPTQSETGR